MKKKDLILLLEASITENQWEIISKLRGLPTPDTTVKRENFLNSLFKKTRSVAGGKAIARNLQQWACKKISTCTGLPWGKDEEIASREMGQSGADVRLSPTARRMFPFTLECKSGKQWDLPNAIRQCKANLYPNTDWMVVVDRPSPRKEERFPPIVVIDGEIFFKIWTLKL